MVDSAGVAPRRTLTKPRPMSFPMSRVSRLLELMRWTSSFRDSERVAVVVSARVRARTMVARRGSMLLDETWKMLLDVDSEDVVQSL